MDDGGYHPAGALALHPLSSFPPTPVDLKGLEGQRGSAQNVTGEPRDAVVTLTLDRP